MLLNILKQFNWVDIFVVIALFRMGYIATKNGLPTELFKLLGTISAVYLSMHYYTLWAGLLKGYIAIKSADFLAFIVLVILGYLVFMLLGKLFLRFIQMEAAPNLNKWGGFILGVIRGVLAVSLIIYVFVISPFGYLKNSVNKAYSAKALFKVAPDTYAWLWNNIMSKFRPEEKINPTVSGVQANLTQE